MDTPQRIQCSRVTGYRMPPHTRRISRPHWLGNPWRVVNQPGLGWCCLDSRESLIIPARDLADAHDLAVAHYRLWAAQHAPRIRAELRGWNLACFCAPQMACHVDVVLELANGPEAGEAAGGEDG